MIKGSFVSTDCGSYKFSTLIEENGKYSMPCLEIIIDGETVDIWDNVEYLKNVVYPYLNNEHELLEDSDLQVMIETFSNVKEDVKEIFDEAIYMGFFE